MLLGLVGLSVGGTVLVMVLERRSSYPVEEMLGGIVWIRQRVSPDIFKAFVRDPDTKQWNAWTFNSCKDYPITKEIQAGVTLCLLKYEVRPGCMSVAKHNLGYTLWRDNNDKPILTSYPGQTATCSNSSPITNASSETAEATARTGR